MEATGFFSEGVADMSMKIIAHWDVMSCSLVCENEHLTRGSSKTVIPICQNTHLLSSFTLYFTLAASVCTTHTEEDKQK
jgi:hypothetical protein